MYKEETIASFNIENKRIQMLQMTEKKPPIVNGIELLAEVTSFQIRINRRIIYKHKFRSMCQKKMYSIIGELLLQQKFIF